MQLTDSLSFKRFGSTFQEDLQQNPLSGDVHYQRHHFSKSDKNSRAFVPYSLQKCNILLLTFIFLVHFFHLIFILSFMYPRKAGKNASVISK